MSMIYATCLIIMFIRSKKTITFSDFPVTFGSHSLSFMLFTGQRFFNQVYTSYATPFAKARVYTEKIEVTPG